MKCFSGKLIASLAGCVVLTLSMTACSSKDADMQKVPLEPLESTSVAVSESSQETSSASEPVPESTMAASSLSAPESSPDTTPVPSSETAPAPTTASAIQTAPETTDVPRETSAAHGLVSSLKASKDTDSLITVVGTGGYQAVTTYYRKNTDNIWEEIFSATGVYGRNGASSDKKEGDGKTPSGVYHFTMAFGLKSDPGSGRLPYHQISTGDFWVDDSDSSHYNQLVTSQTEKDWNSAEDLSKGAPFYNYALILDYNTAQTPDKGSAIFLHCTKSSNDTGSAGCVRIPEARVIELIQDVNENTKIVIAPNEEMLSEY